MNYPTNCRRAFPAAFFILVRNKCCRPNGIFKAGDSKFSIIACSIQFYCNVKPNVKSCVYIYNHTLIAFAAEGFWGGNYSVHNIMEPTNWGLGQNGHAKRFDALVVSNNVATGIIAASMIEKCGLLVQRTELDLSLDKIRDERPSILVIDSSCEALVPQLGGLACERPYTIYLGVSQIAESPGSFIDRFVCKPLTMDGLQPVIFDWIEANRKGGKRASG